MRYFITSIASILLILSSCSNKPTETKKNSYLRLATAEDPFSLDPRLVRDLASSSYMRMLYEGLMRTTANGEVIPAVAEEVTLSDDKKTYTFHLRSSTWSDGSPVTAEDFEQTWKSVLSPSVPAPNAYQLYLIKGAKAAKEGKEPADTIAVKAVDSKTLVVELEQPAPYFLEMVSSHFFFPVHQSMRDNLELPPAQVINNGPFKLENWARRSEFNVVKNPSYWDAQNVALSGISLHILDEHTAFQLFKAGELDWTGSPLSTLPQDAILPLKQQNKLEIAPGAGTHWFRLNTSNPPFDNEKMRQAFALALDRQSIVDHVTQGNQIPAIGVIPPAFGLTDQKYYADHDTAKAQVLFNEALKEENLTKETLPEISIRYASNDRNHKIAQAVQQQWNKTFGIHVALDGSESQVFLDKVKTGNYEIAMGSWYADIRDPINFLEIFKSKDNPTNLTFWQNEAYSKLLDESSMELDPKKRKEILVDAETLLIENMPVVPIFHNSYNYLKAPNVQEVYFSPLGYLDFKNAKVSN